MGRVSLLMPGERFDIPEAWRLIGEHRISNMFTVPTILKMLAEHPAAASADTSSLRHVIYAGAPMYREDQKMILNRLGKVIVQYFGLGEVTGNITVLPPRLHEAEDGPGARIGTCGFPRTGIEVTIQNDAGEILAPHETGEICCIGPAVFAGYHNNPDANAKSFRDGWFRTGDLGHVDEEGFVYITGRASDMYISGGSNIYPREIEEKLLKHPDIVEAAVLGVPDPQWGEIGIARWPGARVRRSARRKSPSGSPTSSPATSCRADSCSSMRCRNPVTARCRNGWCAMSWSHARHRAGQAMMRTIRQPGPAPQERLVGVPALALPISETLKPGRPLVDALHDLVRRKGCDSGTFG